jgi:hypothetical protein
MPFAVIIPCGPDSREIARVTDTVEALLHFEPECRRVLIINDGNPALAGLPLPSVCKVMEHPRRGRGWGWGGGLLFGELCAFARLARDCADVDFVLKLDTDALVIRPFAEALKSALGTGAGLVGSRIANDPLPAGKTTAPLSYFAAKVAKLRAPVGLWRKPRPHIRFAFSGPHRHVAQWYDEAEQNGYLPGELIEGGALAFSMRCLRALGEHGVLQAAHDFLDVPVSDDIVLTMLPYLVGMRAANCPAFIVEPATLRHSPADVLADESAAIIHSVKGFGAMSESEIRAFFRERRTTNPAR